MYALYVCGGVQGLRCPTDHPILGHVCSIRRYSNIRGAPSQPSPIKEFRRAGAIDTIVSLRSAALEVHCPCCLRGALIARRAVIQFNMSLCREALVKTQQGQSSSRRVQAEGIDLNSQAAQLHEEAVCGKFGTKSHTIK